MEYIFSFQFPSEQMCEDCWVKTAGNKTFDHNTVLRFLKKFYTVDVAKYEREQSELELQRKNDLEKFAKVKAENLIQGTTKRDDKRIAVDLDKIEMWRTLEKKSRLAVRSGGFSQIDLSLCVTFYVVCAVIIVLTYVHLTYRRRKSLFAPCRDCKLPV